MMKLPEKALSIRQPWAWAILNAGKNIENRPRRFNYRGPICLHASLNKSGAEMTSYIFTAGDVAAWHCGKPVSTKEAKIKPPTLPDLIPHADELKRGGIIGTADIVNCVEQSESPWFFGPFGLVLENIKPVEFVPVKGALGLFNWRKNL